MLEFILGIFRNCGGVGFGNDIVVEVEVVAGLGEREGDEAEVDKPRRVLMFDTVNCPAPATLKRWDVFDGMMIAGNFEDSDRRTVAKLMFSVNPASELFNQ